jgi:osmotically-inducible protein OsmY
MQADIDLRRCVEDELAWEPSISAADIGVTARDGIITLTGYVPRYVEKQIAARAAKRVCGVKAVANDIEVRIPSDSERTDAEIAESAYEALKWSTMVPHDRINITVSKGWVNLEGDVNWQYQKAAAEDAAHALPGVRGVMNTILLKPEVPASAMKSKIEAAVRRSAALRGRNIRVDLNDGKVTLHGQLNSWAQRDEAERAAWAAPGVSEVENLIEVSPK